MLKPKIDTEQEFEMTLVHGGVTYTFKGVVTDLDVKTEEDYPDYDYLDRYALRRFANTSINMDIQVVGSITRVQ